MEYKGGFSFFVRTNDLKGKPIIKNPLLKSAKYKQMLNNNVIFEEYFQAILKVQVNNFQINSLFHQLSQNMTTDFSLDCSSFYKFVKMALSTFGLISEIKI